jgi:hypothetical protein
MSGTTIFAGVPVGSAPLISEGNFVPTISLTNFSSVGRHITIRYSRTVAGDPETQDLESADIPAMTSRDFSFPNITGESNLQNSFQVISDALPGDIVSKFVSRGDSRLHAVELLGKDLMDPLNGGNHPWSLENGTDSTLLLFNASDSPQYFNVVIVAGGILWQKAYQLKPMQTKALSILDLARRQSKDDKGAILPKDIWSGQVQWHVPNRNAGKGRLLQSNREAAMARNFSCGVIYELCEALFYTYVDPFGLGDTVNFGSITPYVCMNHCYGSNGGQGGSGYTYTYSSNDPSIASIAYSGGGPTVSLLGVDGGSTTINGMASDGYCSVGVYPQPPVTVQKPTALKVKSVTILQNGASGNHGCLPGYYGIAIDVNYQVVDSTGTAIQSSAMTPQEHVVFADGSVNSPGYTNIGPSYVSTTSATTRSDGTFDDAPVEICSPVPFNTPLTNQQSIQVLFNGQAYPVRQQTYSFSSTNLSNQGTITNGSDINAHQP